jgi:hypothetical protein
VTRPDRVVERARAGARQDANQPPLSPVQQRVVESLRRGGLAMVPYAELIGSDRLWAQLAEEASGFITRAEARIRERGDPGDRRAEEGKRKDKKGRETGKRKVRKSDFIIRASAVQGLSPPPALLRYALSDQLLRISDAYLGLRAKLTYVDMWHTAPAPEDAIRIKSQRWHRDHIDPNIVKVFTYFSDVDAEAGAIEYVRGSAAGGPYGHLWAASKDDHYPPDGELERLIPQSACVRAEGPTGTIVLCDTGGFHRGGFGRRPRITANFTYVSPAALAAGRTERRFSVGDGVPDDLSPAASFALT